MHVNMMAKHGSCIKQTEWFWSRYSYCVELLLCQTFVFIFKFFLGFLWWQVIEDVCEQDRHCADNINTETSSCSHLCSGKAVLHILCVCVWSLRYPASNAHAPYCRLWPVWLWHIFPPYLTNGMIFGKKKYIYILKIKCLFRFSLHLLSKTFPI